MKIIANGKPCEIDAGTSVDGLIRSLGLDPRFVIVEHNGEPLERNRYASVGLSEGDRLELVRAVAGG